MSTMHSGRSHRGLRKHIIIFLYFSTFSLPLFLLSPVFTQLNPTPNIALCIANNAQHFPELILSGDDRIIIVWRDARNDNYDIYAQQIDTNGSSVWQPNGISVSDHESSQSSPILVSDTVGGAIVIWGDTRNGSQDCYAQRIDHNGKRIWKHDGVAVCKENSLQDDFAAVPDEQGGAVVVWEDWRSGTQDIYAQKLSNEGTHLWDENGIPVFVGEGDQYDPVLIGDGEGGAIVAWWDFNTPDWNVYAQRIDRKGKQLWDSPIPVCNAVGNQGAPLLISDSKGGAFCIWSDFRNDPNLFSKSQIYAQRVAPDGRLLWEKDGVPICNLSINQQQANFIGDDDGGFIVVWWDDRDIFADIYAQRINADGKMLWDPNGVPVCTAGGVQQIPNLVSNGSGGAIVYWLDYRDDFGDITEDAIYAQQIDANGNNIWKKNGIPVCIAKKEQITPKAVSLGNGSAIVIWSDARGENYDIYLQKISD